MVKTSESKLKRLLLGIKVALAVGNERSIYKRYALGGIPRLITVGENNKIIKMHLAEGEQ